MVNNLYLQKICIKSNMAARTMAAILNLREFILNVFSFKFINKTYRIHLCCA